MYDRDVRVHQIFVIIPRIEEFITECKIYTLLHMMTPDLTETIFKTEFADQFGNRILKHQLKIRLKKKIFYILKKILKMALIIRFYNFKYYKVRIDQKRLHLISYGMSYSTNAKIQVDPRRPQVRPPSQLQLLQEMLENIAKSFK